MLRKVFFTLFMLVSVAYAQRQVLFTIDTMPVYADEFLYMYKKNNRGKDSLSIDKYLNLYIDYKLKVYQALREGYDKDSAFRAEYHKYLMQAAKPYFKSHRAEDSLLHAYYDMSKKEVRFAFLLKRIPVKATPEDTLKLYNKLLDLRKQAIDGADFGQLVVENTDYIQSKKTKGDVGFVTVFEVPYEFQHFLWTHKKGDVSMPIRYANNYYLLKIIDIRPAQGRVHLRQIFLALPMGASKDDSLKVMRKVHTIDSLLKAGGKFQDLARKYSQDYRTAAKGGDMGWITSGQTIPAFENAAFSLTKPGQVTLVRTKAGYHFIQLIERKGQPSFQEQKKEILKYLNHSRAGELIYTSVIDSLKRVYHFKMLGSLEPFYKKADKRLLKGKWYDSTLVKDTTPLFELNGKIYTNAQFARFIVRVQHPVINGNVKRYIDRLFNSFVTQKVKELYVRQLASRQGTPFYYLAREFYDGLLLFNISNDQVWQKATVDTSGLMEFYRKNQHKYDTLAYITVVKSNNAKELKQLAKKLKKYHPSVLDTTELKKLADTSVKFVTTKLISRSDSKYGNLIQQINKAPKKRIWLQGDTLIYINDKFRQIKGLVVADYQNQLEKQWVDKLHRIYQVKVNKQVLDQLKAQIKNSGK